MFKDLPIEGVEVKKLKKYTDDRGWLMEVFRTDEIGTEITPAMSYLSMTKPGVARGPHEHRDQIDYFCFAGPGTFTMYMWDNREGSATYGNRMVLEGGEAEPTVVIVPAGVVHAYKNTSESEGLVVNYPNRLFMGEGHTTPVDELRYEEDPDSPYEID